MPSPPTTSAAFYVFVGDRPAGVALVSFLPDWEPRFLQPVLEQSLGLPVRSFLRASGATFVRGGTGTEAGQRANEEQVRTAVEQANLLVVHGAGAGLPAWALEATAQQAARPDFPARTGGTIERWKFRPLTPGDWYVSPDVPCFSDRGAAGRNTARQPAPLLAIFLPRTLPARAWAP